MKRFKAPRPEPSRFRQTSAGDVPETLEYPVFCLRHLKAPGYCLADCQDDERLAFLGKLHELSQLSWNEIRSSQRHGLGSEKIPRHIIKATIPACVTEDVTFIAIRFAGKKPMVGYRDGAVLHILWLDRDFTLYPH